MARRRTFQARTTPPLGPCDLDPSNRFAPLVGLGFHAISNSHIYHVRTLGEQVKPTVEGQVYQVGTGGGLPTAFPSFGVRGASGFTVWTTRTYPADLVSSKKFACVIAMHGKSDAWAVSHVRLYDVSSGSHLRVSLVRQSATTVNIRCFSFGDPSPPNTIVTCDPRRPIVFGLVHEGAGAVRMFIKGSNHPAAMVGTDTVTLDAAPNGTDCRLDFGGSTGADIDYAGAWWLKEKSSGVNITDDEMIEFMNNPWQIYRPALIRRHAVAAAPSFKSAWARNANTVIYGAPAA